jgi:hypothetical protein
MIICAYIRKIIILLFFFPSALRKGLKNVSELIVCSNNMGPVIRVAVVSHYTSIFYHRPFLLTPLPASVEQSTLSQVRAKVITGAMRELHP